MNIKISRAREWRKFRSKNFFTQARLASVLGISERTVSYVEAGALVPHADTLHKFEVLKGKHENNTPHSWTERVS